MENVSESEKRGVIIFGQQFCDKLELIPIKKRILLRDSAIYQRTPSSFEVSDHKVISHFVGQVPDLVASPSLAQDSNPSFFSEQQPDHLKSGVLGDNRSELPALNNEKADCPPDFSGIKTPVDSTCNGSINTNDDANKVPSIESLSPCTESKLSMVPSFASVARDDSLGTKSTEKVKSLAGDITGDSYSDDKPTIQPDPPCKERKAAQSVTQDVRILWDLNVEMDAWEKADDHHNVESQSDVTSSECMRDTKPDISEDHNLKEETSMSEHDTENNMQPTLKSLVSGGICKHEHVISDSTDFVVCESIRQDQQVATGICPEKPFSDLEPSLEIVSMNTLMSEHDTENNMQPTLKSLDSGGICKHEHVISDSTDFVVCESIRQDQQVATGICPEKPFSDLEPCLEIVSMNTSCNQKPGSTTDEHLTPILSESTSKLADAPRIEPGSSFGTTNYSSKSTEEQNCENKKIVIIGGGSGNSLQTCNDGDSGSSKKRAYAKAGQLEVIDLNSSNQCVDLFERRASVEEGNKMVSLTEKIIAETEAAPAMHHPSELGENSYHVDISMENQLLVSFQEGCDASIVEPPCVPGKCNQDAFVSKQVPNIDTDRGAQTEQDYEDGELRDLDSQCWNEVETEMGETECLDYEPVADSDESPAIVSVVGKVEGGLTSNKHRTSETLKKDQLVGKDCANSDEKVISGLTNEGYYGAHVLNAQLEKKQSGWDQLPKDGHASIDKVQDTHGISSRTSRSELQSCIEIPTLSEDAEEKETVVELQIRPKDIDDSYPAESGSGFEKFSGKRRFPLNIPGRNRMDDWDSERRSSVNYHDIYDNHSGSRRMIMNAKGREHHRSRSPSERSEAYDAPINYSRYSRGRYGRHAEGYRRFVTDDRGDSEFCGRQQFIRRDRSFSPRVTPHFSETFNRSRSRSRTRSPPLWLPSYERVGSRGHRRSPDFGAEDRVKRTRLPLWKSSFASDNEMRYTSPPRGGFIPQNKPRWNDNEDFDMGGPRDRSPVSSFRHKEKFNAACSRERFKSSEDFRPMGYRARMREIASPDRFRGYVSGNDRRKREDSFETGPRKRFYKDGFTRQYRHDTEDDVASQNCPLKDDFLEDGETRIASIRKKESSSHERYEYDQLSYPGSTPNAKR